MHDAIAVLRQDPYRDGAQPVIVFDHENGFPVPGRRQLGGWGRQCRRALCRGQVYPYGSTNTGLGVDTNETIELGDNAVDSGQAKSGALSLRLCREERFEGPADGLGRHARPVVGDRDSGVMAGYDGWVQLSGLLVHVDVVASDQNGPGPGYRVTRVHGQVDDHLLEVAAISVDRPQARRKPGAQVDVLADGPREQSLGVPDYLVHVEDCGMDDLPPAEHQELVGEV